MRLPSNTFGRTRRLAQAIVSERVFLLGKAWPRPYGAKAPTWGIVQRTAPPDCAPTAGTDVRPMSREGAGMTVSRILRYAHVCASLGVSALTVANAQGQSAGTSPDPRVGLSGGHWVDAATAISNLTLDAHRDRPEGFINPANLGDFGFINSDLAFNGNFVFQGNFHGIQISDVSNPSAPTLRDTIVCPGGQGDPSIYGHLLFMSVETLNGRLDCGTHGVPDTSSPARFRGVRIFDISDIDHPKQVADVQTCRGSHTHTLVPDPKDPGVVYVYVQGTAGVRPASELAGCSALRPEQDANTSLFRIEIIRVALAHPEEARIVNGPRIFASDGRINGLAAATADSLHNQRDPMYHATSETNMCHDITVYPAIGLAAGACSGNGILLDTETR